MSEQSILRSPQVVAKELDVSPATLRRWSEEFKEYLSDDATASGEGRSHRRYQDSDLTTFLIIKELMNDGLTYEQVRTMLNGRDKVTVEPDDIMRELRGSGLDDETEQFEQDSFDEAQETDDDDAESQALVASNGAESPAIAFLNNTLAALSDSQKSILNSQAANRELLGVLLQDNFNLKEENNRLRERILEVERQVAQSRQEDEQRREALRQELETKIATANQTANQAMVAAKSVDVPEIKAVETNSGCLGMLLGGGGTQFVTVPRRRKSDGKQQGTSRDPSFQTIPPAPQSSPNHPKPMFPPE